MSEITRSYSAKGLDVQHLVASIQSWFSEQNFSTQVLTAEGGGNLIQVAKRGNWRKFVGLSASLNVLLRLDDDDLTVEIGAGKWLDKAATGTVSMFVLWPLAVTTAFGVWRQMKLPEKILSEIEKILSSPRNVVFLFDPEIEMVPAATERVEVPNGVTASVKRSRRVDHSVSLGSSETTETKTTHTYTEFLSHSVRKQVEEKQGRSFQESETLEYEVTLDGSKGSSFLLTWVDSFRTGTVQFALADRADAVPFRFRIGTDLKVVLEETEP